MGILTERLMEGQSYWVCELPMFGKPFLYPTLQKLTNISLDQQFLAEGRNYECTYEFGDIHIPTFIDGAMKCFMSHIDNFIITKESAKMQQIIRNHVNANLYDGKKIDSKLDIKAINEYIIDVDKNHPELLI